MLISQLVALVASVPLVASTQVVVLGDSFASGNGARDYQEYSCMRSPHGAGGVLADLTGVEVENDACNAAFLSHITSTRELEQRPVAVDLVATEPGLQDLEARLVALPQCMPNLSGATLIADVSIEGQQASVNCHINLQPQADMVTNQTTDVFVTIGGNDVGFGDIAFRCFAAQSEPGCRQSVDTASGKIPDIIDRYGDAVRAIKERNPNVRVHLVPYPQLTDGSFMVGSYDVAADLQGFQADYATQLTSLADELDAQLGGVFVVSELEPLWEQGRADGLELIHTSGTVELLHPTPDGWNLIGMAYALHMGNVVTGIDE